MRWVDTIDLQFVMFGLNLWARPFLPGAPSAMGMEGPGGLARGHPALGLGGAPTYLLPGLTAADKAATSGAMHSPFAPGSLFMYRPENMLHPHILRVNVDHAMHGMGGGGGGATGGQTPEEGLRGPHGLRTDPHGGGGGQHPGSTGGPGSDSGSVESYPSAFQPTKRLRLGDDRAPSRLSDGGHKDEAGFYGDRTGAGEDGRAAGSCRPSPGSGSMRSPDSAHGSPHDARQAGTHYTPRHVPSSHCLLVTSGIRV